VKNGAKRSKVKKDFEVSPDFNIAGIRKIFKDIAFAETVPESYLNGKDVEFDIAATCRFLFRKNMNTIIRELIMWAKIITGRDYNQEEIDYYIADEEQAIADEIYGPDVHEINNNTAKEERPSVDYENEIL
jgi:hypothetical protein